MANSAFTFSGGTAGGTVINNISYNITSSGGSGSLSIISTETQISSGRLTLSSANPITTSDIVSASVVYFTPYNGNRFNVFSSSIWQPCIFDEISIDGSSFPSNSNIDIFAYSNDNVLTLEAVQWSTDTVRATNIVIQDGVYVKSADATRRYVGTVRVTGTTGQLEDSIVRRFVYNNDNPVSRPLQISISPTSNQLLSTSWDIVPLDTPSPVSMVNGNICSLDLNASVISSSPNEISNAVAIGLDGNTPIAQTEKSGYLDAVPYYNDISTRLTSYVPLGFHSYYALSRKYPTSNPIYIPKNGDAVYLFTDTVHLNGTVLM